MGLQLSRQFRALKVWMSIKEHGLERFGRMMARNVEQAKYFGQLIENEAAMELVPNSSVLFADGYCKSSQQKR